MNRTRVLPLAVGLAVATLLATGCYMPAAPDVTPTPSLDELELEEMHQLEEEAAEYTATLEAAESPVPTSSPPPTAQPSPVPTSVPTAEATQEPTETPTTQPTETPVVVSGETTYVVQAGDNLFRIAQRFGLRFQDLAAHNNIINPHRITVGQVLRIPGGTAPSPGPQPSQGEILHTVQAGENLYRIALRYNLNYLYLASYNGIANPHHIYVGQVLRIPTAQ
jgi:LysM repeat protein